jgi:hypothetical protein
VDVLAADAVRELLATKPDRFSRFAAGWLCQDRYSSITKTLTPSGRRFAGA